MRIELIRNAILVILVLHIYYTYNLLFQLFNFSFFFSFFPFVLDSTLIAKQFHLLLMMIPFSTYVIQLA